MPLVDVGHLQYRVTQHTVLSEYFPSNSSERLLDVYYVCFAFCSDVPFIVAINFSKIECQSPTTAKQNKQKNNLCKERVPNSTSSLSSHTKPSYESYIFTCDKEVELWRKTKDRKNISHFTNFNLLHSQQELSQGTNIVASTNCSTPRKSLLAPIYASFSNTHMLHRSQTKIYTSAGPRLLSFSCCQEEWSQHTDLCPDTPCIWPRTSLAVSIYGSSGTPMHTLKAPQTENKVQSVHISWPPRIDDKSVLNSSFSKRAHTTPCLTGLQHRLYTAHPLSKLTRCSHHKQKHTRQLVHISLHLRTGNKSVLSIPTFAPTHPTSCLNFLHERPFTADVCKTRVGRGRPLSGSP